MEIELLRADFKLFIHCGLPGSIEVCTYLADVSGERIASNTERRPALTACLAFIRKHG